MEKIKISDLAAIGFGFGTYAGNKRLVTGGHGESSASIEYRPRKGGKIGQDDECDLNGFWITNYGSSSCISVPIKMTSLEDINAFSKFFN